MQVNSILVQRPSLPVHSEPLPLQGGGVKLDGEYLCLSPQSLGESRS